ncbi:MAG TPA: hypothetical protein VGN46_18830 [Luteibacter sp.]|jgi:hypothetical protein|uniref:hypothetical protein n=1 Tax=Luteibacter sp. TaxID=1886636 RepID=UPI002F42C1A2
MAVARDRHATRPLPEQVVIVAFPGAYAQQGVPVSAPSPPSDFFIVRADASEVSLPGHTADWLTVSPPTAIVQGVCRIAYRATDNTRVARHVEVPVVVKGARYAVMFRQQAGELVQFELVRTLNSPLNIDCLVAIGFIASLIQKIPVPPIKLIVMVLVVLALIALGFAVSAIRHGFVGVPEPKPLSTDTNGTPIVVIPGIAIPGLLPLAGIAAEDQTIALQTIQEIYWLIEEVG